MREIKRERERMGEKERERERERSCKLDLVAVSIDTVRTPYKLVNLILSYVIKCVKI